MERVKKVGVLNNEVEAQLVDGLLSDQEIPHLMRSYHDSAYDGLFAAGAWGHVEAPLNYHAQVRRVIEEVRRQAAERPSTTGPELN